MKRFTSVGKRFKELRGNLTQKEFADKIKVPLRSYQRYESGERMPTINTLKNIAYICDTSTRWILTGETDKHPYKDIGNRLKEIRLPIDKSTFAAWMGVSIQQYSKYEEGTIKPSIQQLKEIAEKRNISVKWILNGDKQTGHPININTEINKKNIKQWIDDFWQKASNEEKIWFKIQFQQAFPEYKSWLMKKK